MRPRVTQGTVLPTVLAVVGIGCGRTPTILMEQRLDACELDPRGASTGCAFTISRVLALTPLAPDALLVANPGTQPTTVQLLEVPQNAVTERNVTEPLPLDPGRTIEFELDSSFVPGATSGRRVGGVYRLLSEHPVSATVIAPGVMDRGNDSTLLLPDRSLDRDYIVASYSPHEEQGDEQFGMQGEPSFFEVVGLEDGTTLRFSAPVFPLGVTTESAPDRPGSPGIPPAPPGQEVTLTIQRHEVVRVAASESVPIADNRDVSGAVIRTSQPVRVVGGGRCARVPVREDPARGFCDPIQEQMIPRSGWGQRYVLAPAPQRDREHYHWRLYAGADLVTIQANPAILQAPDFADPIVMGPLGGWTEVRLTTRRAVVLEGDAPFLPVQYLQGRAAGGEPDGTQAGDPAMIQVAPVERFDTQYTVVVPSGWSENYLQIIKPQGADVRLDGVSIGAGLLQAAEFEIVDLSVEGGAHRLEGDAPFGVSQFGWANGRETECPLTPNPGKCQTSYAHLGGLGPRP